MLRRQELLRGGAGSLSARTWDPTGQGEETEKGPSYTPPGLPQLKERQQPKRGGGRGGWQHRRRGRTASLSRAQGRPHYYYYHHHQQPPPAKAWPRCQRPTRPRVLLSLRPVNLSGQRAPRNTNQFLMGEKYQLMHLRSDSVGTESGGSDCEMDPLDMDSYLGVLENARGALLDGPGDSGDAGSPRALARRPPGDSDAADRPCPRAAGLALGGGGGLTGGLLQEESLPYFPSEHDVIESELFMERDFHEFWSRIA